jgi:hypothetical protein
LFELLVNKKIGDVLSINTIAALDEGNPLGTYLIIIEAAA